MNECKHSHRIGDNYGESCRDCGAQLSGYGWGGFFGSRLTGQEKCIHLWSHVSETKQVCIYCEEWRTIKADI